MLRQVVGNGEGKGGVFNGLPILGGLRERCELPSGVRDGARPALMFSRRLKTELFRRCYNAA